MKFGIYSDQFGNWYWGITDENDKYLAVSSDSYRTEAEVGAAVQAANALMHKHFANRMLQRLEEEMMHDDQRRMG